MQTSEEKRVLRWNRNKKAERERKKRVIPPPRPLDEGFVESVFLERDRRLRSFPWEMPPLPGHRFYQRRLRSSSYPLVCDVWAAEILIAELDSGARITDGKIAAWLTANERAPDVKPASLRTLVGRARQVVRYFEEAPARDGNGPFWPRFPEQVADMGSGLEQHVNAVFERLGFIGRE